MAATWVLVADRARARLFEWLPPSPQPGEASRPVLMELADIAAPEGRLRPRDIEADRLPSTHAPFGPGSHAIEPRTQPQDRQRARFARELCDLLEDNRLAGRFESLVLVASPRFLGALNSAMDRPLRRCVATQVARELVEADQARLMAAIGVRPASTIRP